MFGKKEYCGPDEMGGDHESDAKMKVLEQLRDMAMGMMGEKVDKKMAPPMGDDMKQVTVAADDEAGLKEGLDMAKDVVPGMEMGGEAHPADDMSAEEIDAMIAELESKKREKMMGA